MERVLFAAHLREGDFPAFAQLVEEAFHLAETAACGQRIAAGKFGRRSSRRHFHYTITQTDRAPRVPRDVGFVRHENDRVVRVVQVLEKRHDFFTGFRIEIARRFVGQNDGGIVYQSPRDRDALALAAGKLVRLMVQPITEPHLPQHVRGALTARFRIDAGVNERQLHDCASCRARGRRLKV